MIYREYTCSCGAIFHHKILLKFNNFCPTCGKKKDMRKWKLRRVD